MPKGGKRANSGRKKTARSEVLGQLRGHITDQDFDNALDTLRYAMTQKKKNLGAALSAAQFIIEHKIGKAPLPLKHEGDITFTVVYEDKPMVDID